MTPYKYSYTKTISNDRLRQEITDSTITVALDSVTTQGTAVDIYFKANLSTQEWETLDAIVAAHVATPLPENEARPVTVSSTPAMAAKKLATGERLFKRVHGVRQEVAVGQTIFTWMVPYDWVKFIAIEFINCSTGDYASLNVLDSDTGFVSGYANANLNQFGFTVNLANEFYKHYSEFDADLWMGLQIRLVYNSVSQKTIGVNFIMNEVKP